MKESIDRLEELKQSFKEAWEKIDNYNLEIDKLAVAQQSYYDEYFNLYKTLDPTEIPEGLKPSLIEPIVSTE